MASDARATARRPESAHQPPADDETGGQRDANRDHRAFSYRPATSRQRLLVSAFPLLRALAEPARCAVGCTGNAVDGLVRNMSDTVDRRRSALAGARGSRIDCVVHLGPAFHVVARYVHVQPLSDRSRGSRRPSAFCSQSEQAACHPPFAPETPKRPEIRKKNASEDDRTEHQAPPAREGVERRRLTRSAPAVPSGRTIPRAWPYQPGGARVGSRRYATCRGGTDPVPATR